jgi:hypothetical protein
VKEVVKERRTAPIRRSWLVRAAPPRKAACSLALSLTALSDGSF